MRILVLNGSPRPAASAANGFSARIGIPRPGGVTEPVPTGSCSARLAEAFVTGAQEAGHECVVKHLHHLPDIRPCRACYGCLKSGKCVVVDDMQKLYPEFDRAEAIVFVSPLYYATLPAQVLAVINRLYPYWIDGIRYPKYKAAGVIGVCADFEQSWEIFDATWRSICGEIGWPLKNILHAPRFMEHEESYLAAATNFGRTF